MTLVFYVLFAAAFVGWLATVAMTASLHESDQAGNGLTYSYAMLAAMGTWALLAVLMIVSFWGLDAPWWTRIAALVGIPMSAAAALIVIQVLNRSNAYFAQWPIIMLAVPPILLFAFALWARIPAVRELADPALVFPLVWTTVAALSVLVFPVRLKQHEILNERQQSFMRQSAADALSEQQRWQLTFDALSGSSHLRDVLAFRDNGSNMRDAALARARSLPNRQRDAIAMLEARDERVMDELRNLDLAATPELCAAATEFLQQHAVDYRARVATDNGRFVVAAQFLEKYLFAMQWLAQRGCKMQSAIEAYRATALAYPESPERALFLSRLEDLTSKAARAPHPDDS